MKRNISFHNISLSSKKKTTWKNRSIDYNKCEHLPDKKNPIVMKTCFSEEKLMKQFGNPPLSKRTPLFNWSIFSWPLFVQISKTRTPLILGGEETMSCVKPLLGSKPMLISLQYMSHQISEEENISFTGPLKGTPMQIWKSPYKFKFTLK